VNISDISLLDAAFANFLEIADDLDWELKTLPITLDPGFDSKFNKQSIRSAYMLPVIKPNCRGLKNEKKKHQMFYDFDCIKHFYKKRFRVERTFAWEDTYRKLVVRYEKLKCTADGFRYLAHSLVNFRWVFGKP
jgi:hypothetical protein